MRIGVDLGGTKIEGVALAADGRERWRRRVAAPRGSYDDSVRAIAELVASLEAETGERGSVGVGIPGAVSRATGLVKNANSTWLIGKPLPQDLSRVLQRPVRLANDANCFALSEATDGAGAGAEVVFGVIIGTGTGGGVVMHGRVLGGANAIGGEWGHNPMPAATGEERTGPPCYCGRSGCIETWLSGPALSRDYAADGGEPLSATDIAGRAAAGEPQAAAALARYEQRFARALGTIINVIDPDVIVLGGGLSNVERLYQNVPQLWSPFVFSDRIGTRLVRAVHGDASGVGGAAWLWEEQ